MEAFKKELRLFLRSKKNSICLRIGLDEHHIMIFYYKFASLYFGTGNNKKCIVYLE